MSVAFQTRKRWRNHTGNQWVEPLRIYRPATLAELREIVVTAEADGATVRAVGSGHSWSDVALTTGYLVRTDRLGAPLEVDCVRPDWAGSRLVRVEAGMRIRALNRLLDGQGLALTEMGGYDAQTVAGVVSTSTHGSGIAFGPLCDFLQSLGLVAAGGRVLRIERSGGVRRMYPAYDRWLGVHEELNATGVFDSPLPSASGSRAGKRGAEAFANAGGRPRDRRRTRRPTAHDVAERQPRLRVVAGAEPAHRTRPRVR